MVTRKQIDNVETRVKIEVDPTSESSIRKGQKLLNDLSVSTKKTSTSLADISSTVTASVVVFNTLASGLGSAVDMLSNVAQKLKDVGMRGGDVSAVEKAFERIGSPEVLANLKNATGGLITNLELQQEYTQIYRANLIDAERDTARFYKAVIRASQDVGESTTQMIKSLGDALAKGEVTIFAKLGVNISALQDNIRGMGLSMRSAEGRSKLLNMILLELEKTTGGVDNETGNLNDALTTTTASLQDLYDQTSRNISESEALIDVWVKVNDTLAIFTDSVSDSGSAITYMIEVSISALTKFGLFTTKIFQKLNDLWIANLGRARDVAEFFGSETLTGAVDRFSEPFDRANTAIGTTREYLLDILQILADSRWGEGFDDVGAVGIPRAPRARPRGRGGKGETIEPSGAIDLIPAFAGGELEQLRIQIDLMEQFIAQNETLAEAEAEIREAQRENDERQAEHKANILDMERKHIFLLQESQRTAVEHMRLMEELEKQRVERTNNFVDSVQSFGLAVVGIMDQIGAAQDENTKKAETYKKVKGGILAAISFVEAAQEIARAIGAFPNILEVVSHGLSAAAHIAAGVLALTTLGGSGSAPPQQTAPTSGTFEPRETERVQEERVRATGTQVVIYTMGFSGARLGRELNNSRAELERAGLEPSMAGAGSFSQ